MLTCLLLLLRSTLPEIAPSQQVSYRRRVNRYLDQTNLIATIDFVSVVLTILAVINYIAQTYYTNDFGLLVLDLVLACIFITEWAFFLWLADNKMR